MADFDPTNPMAVIVGFFALIASGLMLLIKFAGFGFAGIFLALGTFIGVMWSKK